MSRTSVGDLIKSGQIFMNNELRAPLNSRERSGMSGAFPYYGATGVMDRINDFRFDGSYVLVAEDGTVFGENGISPMIQYVSDKFWVSNHAHVLSGAGEKETKYLKLALEASDVRPYITGAVQPKLSKNNLLKLPIYWPSSKRRNEILDVINPLDEKIELNRRMNETLEQIGQTLFRHYFIDNPEREKWNMRELGEFFPVRTGKKDANFSSEDGKYPFFTCSQVVSKAPDFSFDCSAIILAGNGDFNIKYYKGKFEAYQRTYVLSPNKEEFLGFLYFLMKRDLRKITGGSRGSVIKFITKGMIENYKIRLPDDNNILILCIEFNSILDKISQNNIEIATLIKIRDSLLPKLIS